MGEKPCNTSSLNISVPVLAMLAGLFAHAAQAEVNYDYGGISSGRDETSELTAYAPGSAKEGLKILGAVTPQAALASRPSPYVVAPSGTSYATAAEVMPATQGERIFAARPSPYVRTADAPRNTSADAESRPAPMPVVPASAPESPADGITGERAVYPSAAEPSASITASAAAVASSRMVADASERVTVPLRKTRAAHVSRGLQPLRRLAVKPAKAEELQQAWDYIPPPQLVMLPVDDSPALPVPSHAPQAPAQATLETPVGERRSARREKSDAEPVLAGAEPKRPAAPVRFALNQETAATAAPVTPVKTRRLEAEYAVLPGRNELVSMALAFQTATRNAATQANSMAAPDALAFNDAVDPARLNALMPAAGTPQPTLTLPDMTALPVPVSTPVPAPAPAMAQQPAPAMAQQPVPVPVPAAAPVQPLIEPLPELPSQPGAVSMTPSPLPQPLPAARSAVTQAPTPVVQTPLPLPDVMDENPAAVAETSRLSPQSKAIVNGLPPERTRIVHKRNVSIDHVQKNPLDDADVRKHEGVGISISVRRPPANVNHMLEQAYDGLMAGDQEGAIALYRQALALEPNNKLALFGLATTYHRAGQIKLARPLYGKLLAIDPHNAEGLNNFLVLLADESPAEALDEMKKLERSHPDFSPLPAQMAVVYEKMGQYDEAVLNMKHAIDLSPENIKYRYDMAVILDKRGDWDNASRYYQEILTAEERGEKIPARAQEIQERLTFIRSNNPQAQ